MDEAVGAAPCRAIQRRGHGAILEDGDRIQPEVFEPVLEVHGVLHELPEVRHLDGAVRHLPPGAALGEAQPDAQRGPAAETPRLEPTASPYQRAAVTRGD